jgi:general secretion pathway protein H
VARNGFTLVELMIVIAVMALLTGAVMLTTGGGGGGVVTTATKFASRMAAARDQAILGGKPISAWVTPSGYGFDRYSEGQWRQMTAKPFDGANWGYGTRVAVASADGARGRIRFDSLGLPDRAFAVTLARGRQSASVRIAANGDVAVN